MFRRRNSRISASGRGSYRLPVAGGRGGPSFPASRRLTGGSGSSFVTASSRTVAAIPASVVDSNATTNGAAGKNEGDQILTVGDDLTMMSEKISDLRSEIAEIDLSIKTIEDWHQEEDRRKDSLRTDMSHALNEMLEDLASAREQLANAKVEAEYRLEREKTMQNDLIQRLSSSDELKATDAASVGTETQMNEDDGTVMSSLSDHSNVDSVVGHENNHAANSIVPLRTKKSSRRMTSKEFLKATKQEFQKLAAVLEDDTLEQIKARDQEFKREIEAIERRIDEENLEAKSAQAKQDADAKREELESEIAREEKLKLTVAESRNNAGRYAQEILDQVRIYLLVEYAVFARTWTSTVSGFCTCALQLQFLLGKQRKDYEEKKAKLQAELAMKRKQAEEAKAEVRGLKSREEMDKELADVQKERDTLAQTIKNVEDMIAERTLCKTKREGMEKMVQKYKATEQSLIAQVASAKEKWEKAQKELDAAKEEAAAVEAERLANEKYDAEEIAPKRAKYDDIMKETEAVARAISETEKARAAEDERDSIEHRELSEAMKVLEKEADEVQQELEATTKEVDALEEKKLKEFIAFENEMKELDRVLNTFTELAESEELRLAQQAKEHEDRKASAQTEMAKATGDCKMAKRRLDILIAAKKLLDERDKAIEEDNKRFEARKKEIWGTELEIDTSID